MDDRPPRRFNHFRQMARTAWRNRVIVTAFPVIP
jgi:hypothetical protein